MQFYEVIILNQILNISYNFLGTRHN